MDLEARNAYWRETALMVAGGMGYVDDVNALIAHGADVNATTFEGSASGALEATAFHARKHPDAARECLRALVQAGANPTRVRPPSRVANDSGFDDDDDEGDRFEDPHASIRPIALSKLCRDGVIECVAELAPYCDSAAAEMLVAEAFERARFAFEPEAINSLNGIAAALRDGLSARQSARINGFLAYWGDERSRDVVDAVKRNDAQALSALLAAGAPVDCWRDCSDFGYGFDHTPLGIAAKMAHRECAEVLLGAGADPHFALSGAEGWQSAWRWPRNALEVAIQAAFHSAREESVQPDGRGRERQRDAIQITDLLAARSTPDELESALALIAGALDRVPQIQLDAMAELLSGLVAPLPDAERRARQELGALAIADAVRDDGGARLHALLEARPSLDVNAENAIGTSALMRAARFGWTETVRQILSMGGDPNAANLDNETALTVAVGSLAGGDREKDAAACLRALLDGGAQIPDPARASEDAARTWMPDALERVCAMRYALCARELVPHCETPHVDRIASRCVGRCEQADKLPLSLDVLDELLPHLSEDAELFVRARYDAEEDEEACLAMMEAARKNDTGTLNALIGGGAVANLADGSWETPFWWAAWGGHIEAARMLLAAGADPRVGFEQRDLVSIAGQPQSVDELVAIIVHRVPAEDICEAMQQKLGPLADPKRPRWLLGPTDLTTIDRIARHLPDTPERQAIESRACEILAILADEWPDENCKALMPSIAARIEQRELSDVLQLMGAANSNLNPDRLEGDSGGEAAMTEPGRHRDRAVAFLAAWNSAKANDRGDTGLMIAARESDPALVEALVSLSNPLALNDAGESAFAIAIRAKKFDCADVLAPHSNPIEVARAFERTGSEKMPRWAARLEDAAGAKEAMVAKAERGEAEAVERAAHAVATTPTGTPQAAQAKPRAMRL